MKLQGELYYSGFFERVWAKFIDGFIIHLIAGIILIILLLLIGDKSVERFIDGPLSFYVFIILPVDVSYNTFSIFKYGTTIGKRRTSLIVRRENGKEVYLKDSSIRSIIDVIGRLILCIGCLQAWNTPKTKTLQDNAADTVVLRVLKENDNKDKLENNRPFIPG